MKNNLGRFKNLSSFSHKEGLILNIIANLELEILDKISEEDKEAADEIFDKIHDSWLELVRNSLFQGLKIGSDGEIDIENFGKQKT